MKRREAERIVITAAGNWMNELFEYIIPECSEEEESGYRASYDEVAQALDIVTGNLEAEDFHKKDAGDWESGRCPF